MADNNKRRTRRKVVVVTGSGKGIGKAIAIEFAKAGYCVIINDFEQEEKLKRTAEEISEIIGEYDDNMETSLVGATTPYYSAYAGSKAPLEDFTRALAKEIGNRGITVNNIAPGPLNTSFFYPAETSDSTEYFKQQSINGKLGEIKDIVPLAKFLVSPEAGWVTAQTIFINGGFLTQDL